MHAILDAKILFVCIVGAFLAELLESRTHVMRATNPLRLPDCEDAQHGPVILVFSVGNL